MYVWYGVVCVCMYGMYNLIGRLFFWYPTYEYVTTTASEQVYLSIIYGDGGVNHQNA